MFDLTGKVVVITGGAGILGRRISGALIERGAKVAIVDRDEGKASEVAASLGSLDQVRAHAGDVTSRDSLESVHKAVRENFDPLRQLAPRPPLSRARF
jgi:NAD(P)-dependent dehydrogenase (short-subunit alcohol dehydrogenase family)